MKLHSFGVAEGQNEGSTGSVFGANRTEQIGRLGALIMSGSGTRALPCPTIGKLVLLADPHSSGTTARAWRGLPQRGRQSFFERLHGVRILFVGLRPRAHMREAQVLQGAIDGVIRHGVGRTPRTGA